jgi:predicted amidohydrolase
MSQPMKIGAVQMDVDLACPEANLDRIAAALRTAAKEGAVLVAFPECAVTGYCFESLEEALPHAEKLPGKHVSRLSELCRETGTFAVVGLLEADAGRLFNACILVGPNGLIGSYRKVHLPFLGIDRFATKGDQPFRVWEAAGVRVGMNICYDSSFPEAARVLALEGADLIVLPTNWPPPALCSAEFLINTRAMENNVYYMAVNRVGTERGFPFIGRSKICDPSGVALAQAPHDREDILYAEIDPKVAREKHLVRVPGKHEIDRFRDRRPEMYGRIVER